MAFTEILWWLIVGHAICDYPLQGDFLARGKNHKAPIPGIPWQVCLAAHSIIHGGAVTLITGSVLFGVIEALTHALFDHQKCEGVIDFNTDQLLHTQVKILLAGLYIYVY